MVPCVVSAVKSGAVSLIRKDIFYLQLVLKILSHYPDRHTGMLVLTGNFES